MEPSIDPHGQPPGLLVTPNAAAQAAGRELLIAALQRKPLAALVFALLSPILGLFRPLLPRAGSAGGRAARTPSEISSLRLESYRSTPILPPVAPDCLAVENEARECERSAKAVRTDTEPSPGPLTRSRRPRSTRARSLHRTTILGAEKGGLRHG